MAKSHSCILRKTFIFFCKVAVKDFSRDFFQQHFLEDYLSLSKDKIATVRMNFAHSIVKMKKHLRYDSKISMELMEILNNLRTDPDRDVVEAIEQCDYDLLQERKKAKNNESQLLELDHEKIEFDQKLLQRE